jgi:hypothetical protein
VQDAEQVQVLVPVQDAEQVLEPEQVPEQQRG